MSKPNQELFIIARFHAREGREDAVAATLRTEVHSSQSDPGCLTHAAYRSIRDARLFFIQSRWVDEAAFEKHTKLPHTIRFAGSIKELIDHELEPIRLRPA
jgi:quinol monooxygenase YgiN